MKYRVVIVALALVSSLSVAPVVAQAPVDADVKEIQAYQLSMATLKQFIAASRNMMAAIKQDPRFIKIEKLKAEIKALGDKEEPTDADMDRVEKLEAEIEALEDSVPNVMSGSQSLSEMERAIQKEPLIANALKSAGMPARDYAKFSVAFFQASMIHGFQKGGLVKSIPKELQAQVNLDNVKFVADNEAEITKLMAEFEAMNKKQ